MCFSVYGFYPDDGVVQMMNMANPDTSFMPTARPLGRAYMMGGVNPDNTMPAPTDGSQVVPG